MSEIPERRERRERLDGLRSDMRKLGLTHYLVPSTDENINEYLPAWRQRRQWVTGFTGSAGDLLVALEPENTWLFTDGRYHLQAEVELKGSGIGLQRVGAEGGQSLLKLLAGWPKDGATTRVLGFDPLVVPLMMSEAIEKALKKSGAEARPVEQNLVDAHWRDRPLPPETPLLACPPEWTGQSVEAKLAELRSTLLEQGADATLAVRLDQIAWLTNLRSLDDIPFNPVFESFLYLDQSELHLFLNGPRRRLPADFGAGLAGFQAHPLEEFLPFLRGLGATRVALDPERVTRGVADALEQNQAVTVTRAESLIESRKALKNEAELKCMEHANLMASVAKLRSLFWLRDQLAAGRAVTERSLLLQLEQLYSEIDGYQGLSFGTISATGMHGAIIHYSNADETRLEPEDLLLIDSGIQLAGGTTDDTRTFAVGPGTDEQRRIYTLVLKGHLRAARQIFPRGTPGASIDTLTRSPLWSERLNYSHGTGHGVGAFLNVHEGPFGIADLSRKAAVTKPLLPGMVTSIEPGYYSPEFGGVRLENLYVVRELVSADEQPPGWLEFFPLTWIPFEGRLIDAALLDEPERAWLDWYHDECKRRVEPYLSAEENRKLDGEVCRTRPS